VAAERGEIRVADNQSFALARFTSTTQWAWGTNALQIAYSRGRVLLAAHHLALPIAGAGLTELLRVVVDAAPETTALLCAAVFGVPRSLGWASLNISWCVVTDAVAGGAAATSSTWVMPYQAGILDPFAMERERELGGQPQVCDWPAPPTWPETEDHVHAWFVHTPDPASLPAGLVIAVEATAASDIGVVPDADDGIILRGATIIGIRGAA
jgi:hypothetical protein